MLYNHTYCIIHVAENYVTYEEILIMSTRGFRIVCEEVSRGDYHSVRLMCMWGAFIMGALTYLSIKSLDYPGNVISATLSELKEGIVRGQVITFPIAAVLLLS